MTVIDCEGEARSVGRAHGEGARSLVRAGLARWEDAVVRPSKRGIERYVTEILSGSGFLAGTQAAAPRLIEEIRGIAEGAGVSFETLFAYNLMDEQWWFDRERPPLEPPGCSVIAAAPMSNRPGLLAQNMDLPAFMDGSQLLLRVRGGGRPEQLVLTAAGMIGLTGVNRAGIGVCVNTLIMLAHARDGIPVAVILRMLLEQRHLSDAVRLLQSIKHASGQHYAIGSPEGAVGLECSAAGAVVSPPLGGRTLTHTNHPLFGSHGAGGRDSWTANSEQRLAYLDAEIGSMAGPADARRILADRTTPICVVPLPGKASQTFGSVVYELADPPRASMCPGLPSDGVWHDVGWTENENTAALRGAAQ